MMRSKSSRDFIWLVLWPFCALIELKERLKEKTVAEGKLSARLRELAEEYYVGLGYKKGDVLQPRDGCNPELYGVKDKAVIVIEQSPLIPHRYKVLGEKENPKTPADKFINFEINGHEWRVVR